MPLALYRFFHLLTLTTGLCWPSTPSPLHPAIHPPHHYTPHSTPLITTPLTPPPSLLHPSLHPPRHYTPHSTPPHHYTSSLPSPLHPPHHSTPHSLRPPSPLHPPHHSTPSPLHPSLHLPHHSTPHSTPLTTQPLTPSTLTTPPLTPSTPLTITLFTPLPPSCFPSSGTPSTSLLSCPPPPPPPPRHGHLVFKLKFTWQCDLHFNWWTVFVAFPAKWQEQNQTIQIHTTWGLTIKMSSKICVPKICVISNTHCMSTCYQSRRTYLGWGPTCLWWGTNLSMMRHQPTASSYLSLMMAYLPMMRACTGLQQATCLRWQPTCPRRGLPIYNECLPTYLSMMRAYLSTRSPTCLWWVPTCL